MCKDKNGSIVDDLLTKRLQAFTEAQQTQEHNLRNALQALTAKLELSLNTKIGELRCIAENLNRNRGDQLGILNARLNDHAKKLTALSDSVDDLQGFTSAEEGD